MTRVKSNNRFFLSKLLFYAMIMEVIGKHTPIGATRSGLVQGNINSLPVSGAKYVQMPRENYDIILAKLHDQESKLKASLNLHILLMDKEKDNQRLQERNTLLEKSTAASELRLGNLIRLHIEKLQQFKSLSGLDPNDRIIAHSGTGEVKLQQHQEGIPANNIESSDNFKSLQAPFERKSLNRSNVLSHDKENIQPRLQEGIQSGVSSLTSRKSGISHARGLSVPGISRALFDKIVFENLKLKQLLDENLKTKGKDLDEQLDAQEYEDIIQQLRVELASAKDQIKNLTDALHASQSGDDDNLQQHYAELTSYAGRLQKNLQAKQTLISSYNKEYEKMKIENHELKKRLIQQTVSAHTLTSGKPSQSSAIPRKPDTNRETTDKSTETETGTGEKAILTHDDSSADTNGISSDKKTIQNLKEQVERLKGLLINQQQQFEAKIHHNSSQMEQNITRLSEELRQLKEKAKREEFEWQEENDRLHRKLQQLEEKNSQLVKELANTELLQMQLNTYEEDFKHEKVESLKTREMLEKKLSTYQQTISKLNEEKQMMIAKYKREQDELYASVRQKIQPSWSPNPLSCGQAMRQKPAWFNTELSQQVTMDNVPSDREELSFPPQKARSPVSPEMKPPQGTLLICERCEREFPPNECAKYADHISKCTDD